MCKTGLRDVVLLHALNEQACVQVIGDGERPALLLMESSEHHVYTRLCITNI